MPLVLNPDRQGLEKVLRDYQIASMKMVWENAESGATSREVYLQVNDALKGNRTISRASIINFLNDMCNEGILKYEEENCKGGTRRKYFPGMDEEGFKRHIAKTAFDSLLKDFPNQTVEALCSSLNQHPDLKAKFQGCLSD